MLLVDTPLGYARSYDGTVAADYYRAMNQVEKELALTTESNGAKEALTADERNHLMALASQLAEPTLSTETRLNLVGQLQRALNPKISGQFAHAVATNLC